MKDIRQIQHAIELGSDFMARADARFSMQGEQDALHNHQRFYE